MSLIRYIKYLYYYRGSAPVLTRLPFFAILGLVGVMCGIGLGVVGPFIQIW
jgi:hypothetical protein